MNSTYHYVVLRLATDDLRGELINVGIVLFAPAEKPRIVMMATLNKLRALDASWDSVRYGRWIENIQRLVEAESTSIKVVSTLGVFRFCDPEAVGSFHADSQAEVTKHLADIKATYVANKALSDRPARERKTRLHTALKEQFKRMHILGIEVTDVAAHLVVPNVPVPDHPELKTDFVYKNGTYRITQTLDYRVAPDSFHNKLAEACVKSTAAELAMKSYGPNSLRLAVLDIPQEFEGAADAHVDLLLAQGFEIFHYNDPASMADYLLKGAPAPVQP